MVVALIAAAPLAERASDHENGWWHDPDGALIYLAGLIVIAGPLAGAGLGVTMLRQKRALATAWMMVPVAIAASIAMAAIGVPWMWYLLPAIAASASRALIAPR
ncbi:unnamed protein product [marine sediment metagenome]|uniref:Uncharacterized protein n=1 Tax=marine sediment metagenome TaxID=412755 RepID=X1CGK5_9ZZZZ